MITVRIADLNIGIKYRYSFTEEYVKAYATDGKPDFIVEATEDDLRREREMADNDDVPYEYLEYVAVYRKIADKLTEYDGAVFHGAVIELDGVAYAITARSGVGKTTHIRLWLERFGAEVSVLNGDKPVLRFIDGVLYACGTPYMGKEGYGKNAMLRLGGIAFLERAAENSYSELSCDDGVLRFMSQIYMNSESAEMTLRTLRISDRIISSVPLYVFRCNMDTSAAEMARAAFTKKHS